MKASKGLRVAAAFCLGSVAFAAIRICLSNAGRPLSDLLSRMGSSSVAWILPVLPFAIFASAYVLVRGRVPNLKASPVGLEENTVRPKWHWLGMTVIWTAIAGIVGLVVYVVYFFE